MINTRIVRTEWVPGKDNASFSLINLIREDFNRCDYAKNNIDIDKAIESIQNALDEYFGSHDIFDQAVNLNVKAEQEPEIYASVEWDLDDPEYTSVDFVISMSNIKDSKDDTDCVYDKCKKGIIGFDDLVNNQVWSLFVRMDYTVHRDGSLSKIQGLPFISAHYYSEAILKEDYNIDDPKFGVDFDLKFHIIEFNSVDELKEFINDIATKYSTLL